MISAKKIQIGPFMWTLTDCPPDDDMGGTNFETLTISVQSNPDHNPQIEKETLLHEILHAVLYCTPYHRTFTDEEEETLIQQLSPLLYQALQQVISDLQ